MNEQVKSIDAIFGLIDHIDPRAATRLVKPYGVEFARDVARNLILDRQSAPKTGENFKLTWDYLREKLNDMAFTVMFGLYLESESRYGDAEVFSAIEREAMTQPQEVQQLTTFGLHTYDPREYYLVPRHRKYTKTEQLKLI